MTPLPAEGSELSDDDFEAFKQGIRSRSRARPAPDVTGGTLLEINRQLLPEYPPQFDRAARGGEYSIELPAEFSSSPRTPWVAGAKRRLLVSEITASKPKGQERKVRATRVELEPTDYRGCSPGLM